MLTHLPLTCSVSGGACGDAVRLSERPLEVMYFVEAQNGERIPAEKTAATLNRLDLQRAAIVLGHRVQRPLAQRESHLSLPPLSVSHLSLSLSAVCLSHLSVSSNGDPVCPSGGDSEQQYLADCGRGCPSAACCFHHHPPLLETVRLRETRVPAGRHQHHPAEAEGQRSKGSRRLFVFTCI